MSTVVNSFPPEEAVERQTRLTTGRKQAEGIRPPMRPVVILCSNAPEFCSLLQYILEAEGFAVCLASRLDQLLRLDSMENTRAILLDCESPSIDPKEICRAVEGTLLSARVPIAAMVGTAGEHHMDLVASGIEACLVRPLAPARLLQFLRSGLADTESTNELGRLHPDLTLQDLQIQMNAARNVMHRQGRCLDLTPITFRLLRHFIRFPDCVHSRSELAANAWPRAKTVGDRTVDVHVARLRHRMRTAWGVDAIQTIRSAGYQLQSNRICGDHSH